MIARHSQFQPKVCHKYTKLQPSSVKVGKALVLGCEAKQVVASLIIKMYSDDHPSQRARATSNEVRKSTIVIFPSMPYLRELPWSRGQVRWDRRCRKSSPPATVLHSCASASPSHSHRGPPWTQPHGTWLQTPARSLWALTDIISECVVTMSGMDPNSTYVTEFMEIMSKVVPLLILAKCVGKWVVVLQSHRAVPYVRVVMTAVLHTWMFFPFLQITNASSTS